MSRVLLCDEARARLAWFAGGDLDDASAAQVRTHLMDCVTCRNEASALQRAGNALRAAAASPVPGVDEAFFAAMHRSIVAQVAQVEAADVDGAPAGRGLAPMRAATLALAAGALVALGCWWGMATQADPLLTRTPIGTPAAHSGVVATESMVVPWAGPRAQMRPLGSDTGTDGEIEAGQAQGLRARDQLRTLADENGWLLPPPPKRLR